MEKLNLAIIGQGRSGRDIHGSFYRSERNLYYKVKYVIDFDEGRRKKPRYYFRVAKLFPIIRNYLIKKTWILL